MSEIFSFSVKLRKVSIWVHDIDASIISPRPILLSFISPLKCESRFTISFVTRMLFFSSISQMGTLLYV